jgi:hypothetical protein
VSGDHDTPYGLDEGAEFVDTVHAIDVVFEAEDDDVAVLGVDLDAGDDEEVVALPQFGDLLRLPEEVVLGEADAVEAGLLRQVNEIINGKEAIVGEGLSVGVEVDQQRWEVRQARTENLEPR